MTTISKHYRTLIRMGLDQNGKTLLEALQRLADYEGEMLLDGRVYDPVDGHT